jgi:chitinase
MNNSKLVTYYNSGHIHLSNALDLPYSTINLAFLFTSPTSPMSLQLAGAIACTSTSLSPATIDTIKKLQQAGKKVLISFGGATMDHTTYSQIAGNETQLANSIATFITENSLDGVDIDWEDTIAFSDTATAGYDGVKFLVDFTNALREALPEGAIITHAPQPPYLEVNRYAYGNYVEVMQQVGDKIDWLNVQFYNNLPWSSNPNLIVKYYAEFAALSGCTPEKIVVGLPVNKGDAGSGYINIYTIIQSILSPLESEYPDDFGGFMNWQFSSDAGGVWAKAIGNALQIK